MIDYNANNMKILRVLKRKARRLCRRKKRDDNMRENESLKRLKSFQKVFDRDKIRNFYLKLRQLSEGLHLKHVHVVPRKIFY